jgi:hypothetical protein
VRKFAIARVHYNGMFDALNWSTSILEDLDALTKLDEFIKSGDYYWSIADAEQNDMDDKRIVSIRITKIKPVQELEVIDEATREESLTEVADVKEREGMVYIDIDSHLAAVETHGHLTKNQIADMLTTGYERLGLAYRPIFDYAFDDDKVLEHLEEFGAARRATFALTTTNPHANDEFRPLDNHFRESQVQKSYLTFVPKDDGKLDITNRKSIVRQSLMMAVAGYGSGTITGHDKDGKAMVLELGENLVDTLEIHESFSGTDVIRKIIFKFKNKDKSNG